MSCHLILKYNLGIFSIPLSEKFKFPSCIIHLHSLSCFLSCWKTVLNPPLGFFISNLFAFTFPPFALFFFSECPQTTLQENMLSLYWTKSGRQPCASFNIRADIKVTSFNLGIFFVVQWSCPSSFEKLWVLNPKLLSSLWAFLVWCREAYNHRNGLADTSRPPEVTSLNFWWLIHSYLPIATFSHSLLTSLVLAFMVNITYFLIYFKTSLFYSYMKSHYHNEKSQLKQNNEIIMYIDTHTHLGVFIIFLAQSS